MAVLRPTKHKHEVPELFREPHVETGFRPLHQPWWYYIASLFQPHNECLNTWTHLIGVVLTLSQLYEFSQQFDLLGDPYMWPLLSGMTSMLAMYCCSTGAHWFQSRSELVHFTCFMIDYAGIGLYGLGSTQLHYAYSCDQWLFSWLQTIYLPVGIVLAILTCLCCSISKTMYHRPYPFKRKIWQIGSVAGTYIWLILPVVHRLFKCWQTGEWEDSMEHHVQQMLWFMTSGFFYGSDIPQRFYPGKFDFLGHSHQMFHLCVLMTSYKQMDSLVLDIRQHHDEIYARPTPTFCSTFGAVLFATLANILVVRWFREYVKRSNRHITCTYPSNGHSNGLQNGVHTSHAKHE